MNTFVENNSIHIENLMEQDDDCLVIDHRLVDKELSLKRDIIGDLKFEIEAKDKRIAALEGGLIKFKSDYLAAGHDDCGQDNALDDVLNLIGEKWYD